jgi:phage head maturation protease
MTDLVEFEDVVEAFSVDLQRRTITGVVVPWGKLGRHRGGNTWRFARGSLKYGDVKYIRLNDEHDQSQRIGRGVWAEDTDEGLVVTFKVFNGPAGDRALKRAQNGERRGLSAEIEADVVDAQPDPADPTVTLVTMANFTGAGLVRSPAFEDARLIKVVASSDPRGTGMPPEGTTDAPETPPAETPTTPETPAAMPQMVTFTAEQFTALIGALPAQTAVRPVVDPTQGGRPNGHVEVNEPLPYRFSRSDSLGQVKYSFSRETEHDFSRDLMKVITATMERRDPGAARERLDGFIKASFADVEIADVPGTRVAKVRPDMWVPQLDYATPLWDMVGRGPIDGMPFYVPKFTSSSGLVSAATEKTEPAGGSFVDELQTITPGQLWGKVEITRQLWRTQGTPALSGILWEQMLREFYEDREAAIATFLNTLTAAADITLTAGAADNDAKQARTAQLEAAFVGLNFVRGGNRFTGFAVQQDLYAMAASTEDDSGRPKYPMLNPMNANGTTASLYRTMNIGGTTAVPAYALGAGGAATPQNSWLFDPSRVMSWAGAPERLFWDFGATVQTANIPQLSFVTVGLYADYANANTDIAGVRQVIWDPVA